MRPRYLGVALLLAAGCTRAIHLETHAPNGTAQAWSTTLLPSAPATGVRGAASLQSNAASTTIAISLTGMPAGSHFAWQIRRGLCGGTGPTLGTPAAYVPLEAGGGGRAAAQATVDTALEPGADYAVDVHATADPLSDVIACGELQMGNG